MGYLFNILAIVIVVAAFVLAWRFTDDGWGREFVDWFFFVLLGACLAIFGVLLLVLPDWIWQKSDGSGEYVVIDRAFAPARSGTGAGYDYSGSSGGGPVVVSTYEPEKWQVIVDIGGEPVALDSTKRAWHNAAPGKTATVVHWRGAVWGLRMSSTVLEVQP